MSTQLLTREEARAMALAVWVECFARVLYEDALTAWENEGGR